MLRSMLSFKKDSDAPPPASTSAASAAQAVSWEAHAAGLAPAARHAAQASSLKPAGAASGPVAGGAPLVPTRSRARFADGPTTDSPTHAGETREAATPQMSKTKTEDGKTPISREAALQAIKRSAPSLLPDTTDTNVMAQFIDILKETFENTEQMQEDRIKMLQQHEEENERLIAEHEEEKNRLREEMEDELERERAVLVAYNEREKEELLKELDTFREDTAKTKAEMESQMVETKAEVERMALEKEEVQKDMERFRQDMEEKIAMEKEQARRECDTLQQDKVALQDEKMKMEADMAQSIEQRRIESQRAAKEKEQMVNDIGNFRKECETRMEEQRKSMEEDMQRERRKNEERIAAEKKKMTLEMETMRSECQRYEHEKDQMLNDLEVFRKDTERKMAEERSELEAKMSQERKQFQARIEQEKQEMANKMRETRQECERLESEKVQLHKEICDFRLQTERKMAEEKAEMEKKMNRERREFEQIMAEEKRAMQATMAESKRECDQMADEKEQMVRDIDKFRAACEAEMAGMRANKEAEMEEARREMNEKLAKEQQITAAIFHAIRELPPLQTAMELGDIFKLQEELDKWSTEDRLPERFGECKGVVEAVIKLAKERLIIWRNVEHTLMDVLREVGPTGTGTAGTAKGTQALFEACHRLFRAVKEAQLTKMNLHRSHKKEMEQVCQVFLEWQAQAMQNSNNVQRAIINKVCMCPQLGSFDFVDMDVCLRLVDRSEEGAEVFLNRALMIVEDPKNQPKDLKPLLSHVETMLFFLKYVKSEDLRLTYQEFRKQSLPLSPVVSNYLDLAAQAYPPGAELVQFSSNRGLMDRKDVSDVLAEVRSPPPGRPRDQLGPFREIFYHWAVAMQSKFDLLVLPHHTQVVCLLMIHFFMQQAQQDGVRSATHALIAQVGTGEGKSMIVASLAIYVAVVLRKQVHVVVDDETLLERDFFTFKDLFDNFKTKGSDGVLRPLTAALCVSDEKFAARAQESSVVPRVDPDVDICYCEAKHVQSFYASIARGEKGKQDFDTYANRVLILDEVDALVIDEEPNEVFVYENKQLGQLASAVARAMADGRSPDELKNDSNPAAARVVREMQQEWDRGQKLVQGEEYVYSKETARYCLVQGGRANPKAWSLALECKNFQDGLSRDILFKERLFVMSRPRVFRKYHRIIGLSGSIGSEAERAFLKETYRAEFFEVPPFLKCCRGSPFHEPVPAPLGEKKQSVYIEANLESQIQRLCEVALEARERVPVLVIAKDRPQADQIVERLRAAARSRGLGGASLDIIRSLSRTLYEQDPERWKENLNRATMPIGEKSGGSKTFRCTVTDPRGGRGTDYRVDDNVVDERGGLLLIPTMVPTSQRDWVQFLGRTARQDRKGQFCAVLNSADYNDLSTRFKQSLPPGLEAIKTILRWADMDIADRIKKSAALYNCGVRMNEICEMVFGKKQEILTDASSRELMVEACQRLRYMSIKEIDDHLSRIPSLQPTTIRTEARDLGRPAEPPTPVAVPVSRSVSGVPGGNGTGQAVPKIVIFALDWSASMMSNDTGNGKSRWTTCLDCVKRIIKDQVSDTDYLGVIGFGPTVETVIPVSKKTTAAKQLQQKLSTLQPKMAGGTAFFDAISDGLGQLTMKGTAPASVPKWLICLTDGDDIGSKRENVNGELVARLLKAGVPPSLNMVMITVGSLKEKNVKIIDSWIEMVGTRGGFAQHMRDTNAAQITESFEEVLVAADVGGATEC